MQQKPNVVFILTDDQGPWAMGCAGNHEIRTPNLDRLAASGTRFENFFCTSPVCSPSRASFLTGRMPSAHGVHDWVREGNVPPDHIEYMDGLCCYPEILRQDGYATGLCGKWHLGASHIPQGGLESWYALQGGSCDYNAAPVVRDGKLVVEDGYITDVITDEALKFLDGNARRPFYLHVTYNAPHAPWTGHPQEIMKSYDDCPFETCPQGELHPWARGCLAEKVMGNREMLKGYFSAVTAMDGGVGRIIGRLEELGLRENTIVAFFSDNGFSCGHHGFWGKGNGTFPLNMYENSVKIPAILSSPGRIPGGTVTRALVSAYDWMPTLLDFLDLPRPDDPLLPGTSMLPVITGEADELRDEVVVFDEYGPVRMIRTREWKYIRRFPDGPDELYDLVGDPGEDRNLADEPGHSARVDEMRSRMETWFGRHSQPERDGAALPVSGSGQLKRVYGTPEEGSFYPRQ